MKRSARTVTALAAGVALVVAVTTGATRADTWTVEPGGPFTATEVGDCVIPVVGRFDLIPQGSWQLIAVSHDASTGVTFTNGDSRLQLLPHHTVLFVHVDPDYNCFGLVEEGQHGGVTGTFEVDPGLEISSS